MKKYKMGALAALMMVFGLGFQAVALEVGDEAPCVVLDGLEADGADTNRCIRDRLVESQQYTLIDFFSIRCSTCLKNLPKISALAQSKAIDLQVRAVSVDRDVENVREFVLNGEHAHQFVFPTAFDNERMATRAYGVFATPTLFILDADYNIVYKHVGTLTDEDVDHISALVSGQ